MPEPVTITLAAVGMAAITEGIKFLYGQASELIKWRHEKHKTTEGTRWLPRRLGFERRNAAVLEP